MFGSSVPLRRRRRGPFDKGSEKGIEGEGEGRAVGKLGRRLGRGVGKEGTAGSSLMTAPLSWVGARGWMSSLSVICWSRTPRLICTAKSTVPHFERLRGPIFTRERKFGDFAVFVFRVFVFLFFFFSRTSNALYVLIKTETAERNGVLLFLIAQLDGQRHFSATRFPE